ncbi:MAG: UDP-N-acetylmuramate--L-alanine ligase [Epulopiscium sp. Nele67-Bin005]|nr:MAG: UDP-N-acetylmuramate--L-alanine ligase [Epulopiscium sp. Nele67-Bin005]
MANKNLNIPMDSINKIHFIGIGGISMSGLAHIMHTNGYSISGSDRMSSHTTKHLETLGITVIPTHSANNICDDIDMVVYTGAIAPDNEELVKARETVKYVLSRSKFLGLLMSIYETAICVSGTHGKTTTTSMLAEILLEAKKNPTITVGGMLNAIGGNIHIGEKNYFLTEACEYQNSFLDFSPEIGIILNVEEDHMDFFKDINDIRNSFTQFVNLIPEHGFLAINEEIPNFNELISDAKCKVETFGFSENATWRAINVTFNEFAHATFDVVYKGEEIGQIKLRATGAHNILNALSTCATSNFMKIMFADMANALFDFTGVDQRFQVKGYVHDIVIIDDYAHHPTEISATLNAARNYPHNSIYVVFQPHTYTRTKAFLTGFAESLSLADHIIITDIYAAREKDPKDIHAKDIVTLLENKGCDVTYIEDFDEIADHLLINCVPKDMIITMGAGNINQVADILLGQ